MNNKPLDINQLTDISISTLHEKNGSNLELIRVFDCNLDYAGTATRLLCHRLGLFHEVTNCFILNSKNQILIQSRIDKLSETYDLSIGGHVNLTDKTCLDALLREGEEELNIQLIVERVQQITSYKRYGYENLKKPRETNNEIRHLFCYFISDIEEAELADRFSDRKNSEAESYSWMTIREAIDIIAHGLAFDGLQVSLYYLMDWLNSKQKNG